MSERSETKEFRRRQQQGLGAPIDSWEANESRHVRVNDIFYKSNTWRTFEDFLFDYVKLLLTADWAKPEFSKPVMERHPLMRWYDKLCEFQKSQAKMASEEIYFSPTTGAVKAFLNIAYNLYLCHAEVLHLLEALNLYARVPSTFDDRAPAEIFTNVERFQIGQKLLIPDEQGLTIEGELISGLVIENRTKAWCQFKTAKGFCMVTSPLTEAETAIYNRSPETFFGTIQDVRKPVTESHECYDFIFGTYKNASKESLLKLIEGWQDFEALQKPDQAQLAKAYSERVSTDMWLDGQKRASSKQ